MPVGIPTTAELGYAGISKGSEHQLTSYEYEFDTNTKFEEGDCKLLILSFADPAHVFIPKRKKNHKNKSLT